MMKTDARVTYPDALPLKFPSRCGVSRPCGVTRNEQGIEDRSLRDLVHRRDLPTEKFARADMQLHQTDEFGASRKDAGHDEVGRIVYRSLIFSATLDKRDWGREGEREREKAFLPWIIITIPAIRAKAGEG